MRFLDGAHSKETMRFVLIFVNQEERWQLFPTAQDNKTTMEASSVLYFIQEAMFFFIALVALVIRPN